MSIETITASGLDKGELTREGSGREPDKHTL
jgi:hypothetical protein